MKAYPNYKDSGVSWLGDVPEHWESMPLCSISKLKSISNCEHLELLSVYLDKGVVRFTDVNQKRTNATSEDRTKYQKVDPGDFVLNNQQAWRGSVGVSKHIGIVSPAYLVLSVSEELDAEYANYMFRERTMVGHYLVSSKGVGSIQRNLYWPQLKRVPVFVPTQNEQQQISRYLDWQTSKINKFIKVKKRLIALLRMQNEVLAFGKQDNSQISVYEEWRNLFPKHWNFEKAKRIFVEINIKNNENKELLAVTQDRGVLLKSMCAQNFVSPAGSVSGLKLVSVNDFVISLRSFQGGIEFSEYEGIVSPAYTVMSLCDEFNSEKLRVFYRVLFKSKNFIRLLNTVISGIRDGKNISFTDFSKLEIPTPPR